MGNMIISHYPADLMAVVSGSAEVNAIQDALKVQGQFIPIGPFCEGITIEEAIIHNLIGTFSDQFGTLQNWLLNTTLRTLAGEFSTGADVMKNVSGYDLTRLLIGSCGKLGMILRATFKLLPVEYQPVSGQPPLNTGFRLITLPSEFSKIVKNLHSLGAQTAGFENLGVIEILPSELLSLRKLREIAEEFGAELLEICHGKPVENENANSGFALQIFRLFQDDTRS